MKKIWMVMGCSLLLAACGDPDKEATSIETPVAESENESTQVTEPLDEDYAAFLEHHSETELEDVRATGEKLMYAYYSKLDTQLYNKLKEQLVVGAQTEIEDYIGVLDKNKDYEIENIKSEYIQGFDAPEVHILYTVDYFEVSNGDKSEVKTNEFVITALDWKDKEGLGISKFEDKTLLDENSLFN